MRRIGRMKIFSDVIFPDVYRPNFTRLDVGGAAVSNICCWRLKQWPMNIFLLRDERRDQNSQTEFGRLLRGKITEVVFADD